MQTQRRPIHHVLTVVVASSLVMAACGGSDDATDSAGAPPPGTAPAEVSDSSADTDPGSADDDETAVETGSSAMSLDAAQTCLEAGGYTVAPGDETSTGLSEDMMANLGIDEILVFADAAGSAGTIEAYASTAQAELAADGYEGSPLGYRVGADGEVVFKTTGAAEVIDEIAGCLRGEPIEAAAMVEESEVEEPVADEPPAEESEAAESAIQSDVDATVGAANIGPARTAILDILITPDLEAQGVVFDRACLETWSMGLSDADAELFATNGGDTEDPGVSDDARAQAERVFTCLDLDRLSVDYAADGGFDEGCVAEAFASVDLVAVVDERGADIDEIFRALSGAAFDSCG